MAGLRARVAKKAQRFVKKAQAMPPGAAPAPPGPAAPGPGAPPPPGAPPGAAPKPPGRPPLSGGPGGAPPGAPPGAPKPKEEVEQEVEKDIRKRKETENKINELDEKVTAISDQMEGLTKSINKLVNTIQKDKGGPTDFEKKFEEVKEEDEDDGGLSSSEFGLGKDDDSLIVSKEGHKMSDKEKLRKARKERLKAKELTFELKDMPNKKYKQQVPSPTITKLKDEPEDWGQYRLKASDMALDLNASGDEWAVVNKHTDQIFYKIKPTAETKDAFPTREFAEAVINDVREMGLEAAMEKYGALPMEFLKKKKEKPEDGKPGLKVKPKEEKKMPPFIKKKKEEPELDEEACVRATTKEAQVDEGGEPPAEESAVEVAPAEEATEELAAEETAAEEPATEESVESAPAEATTEEVATEETAEESTAEEAVETATEETAEEAATDETTEATASLADVQRRFVRAFRLALSAQQKNLTENPLKAAWYETLKGLDVPNPEKVIEATFARAASEHFEVALMKTAEFLDMSDEAFVEMEAQIGELNTQPPKTASEVEADEQHKRAAALRARAQHASLPLSTASDAETADYASKIEGALPKPKLHGVSKFANK